MHHGEVVREEIVCSANHLDSAHVRDGQMDAQGGHGGGLRASRHGACQRSRARPGEGGGGLSGPGTRTDLAERRTRLTHDHRRRIIVNAAVEVFAEKEYSGAAVVDVSDRAGITKTTLTASLRGRSTATRGSTAFNVAAGRHGAPTRIAAA